MFVVGIICRAPSQGVAVLPDAAEELLIGDDVEPDGPRHASGCRRISAVGADYLPGPFPRSQAAPIGKPRDALGGRQYVGLDAISLS